MKQDLNIIKVGGNILDDAARLDVFLREMAALRAPAILVHGGGKIATAIGERLGIESKYEQGRRVTDSATLELVTMVYAGLVNKQLVARLQALQCNAIGLTGADADIIRAVRRPVRDVDYGFVGDVLPGGVSGSTLTALIRSGLTPVIAPLTHDGAGTLLNTNADTMAQETARALAGDWNVRLVYCFEKPGVLADAADDNSAIPRIDRTEFDRLTQAGIVSGGMIPKLHNALEAVDAGVSRVIIGQAESLRELLAGTKGTHVQ